MNAPADKPDALSSMIRYGRVATVDLAAARCTVDLGEITSGPLPWFALRAGTTRRWSPPSVDEQVLVLCPEGDLALGAVFPGIYSDAHPAPSAEDLDRVEYADGTWIGYDPGSKELTASLTAGGKIRIVADAGVSIQGDVAIEGKLTATQDVIAAGVSLKDHLHNGVQVGAALSGKPVAQ